MKEAKDRYVFLRTAEHNGEIVALIADSKVLGPRTSDLQNAFRVHASPVSRAGVLTYTLGHLRERLPELEKKGMDGSVAAFKRAIECIEKRSGGKAPGHDENKPNQPPGTEVKITDAEVEKYAPNTHPAGPPKNVKITSPQSVKITR